jgi:stage II sporulation protein P
MQSINKYMFTLAALVAAFGLTYYAFQHFLPSTRSLSQSEGGGGSYYTVYGPEETVLLETGLPVQLEDRFISADNTVYQISRIDAFTAWAEALSNNNDGVQPNLLRKLIVEPMREFPKALLLRNSPLFMKFTALPQLFDIAPAQASDAAHVVIYHTHTDECYALTSNTDSRIGDGDILEVGARLAEQLMTNGVSVTHDFTLHDPHDINAYNRSRKTLARLLREQPDAAFDIHRDAAPTDSYLTSNNGLLNSRIMIVIGRSNPHMITNLDYAQRLKEVADAIYPDLIRGIYMGKGDYNQDLYPTALLFEIGTDAMSRDLADKAVTCLADILQVFLQQPY